MGQPREPHQSEGEEEKLPSHDSGVGLVRRVVEAPPGKLGIVIDSTSKPAGPVVHEVKEGSPLEGMLFPGDRIVEIDDVVVRNMNAEEASELMARRAYGRRRIAVLSSHHPVVEPQSHRSKPAGSGRSCARNKWMNAEFVLTVVIPVAVGLVAGFWKYNDLSKTHQYSFRFRGATYSFDEIQIFSDNFFDARRKFRDAARALDLEAKPYTVREHFPDLVTDVVVRSGELPGIVVHLSGVGGVDGYAGSAIQTAFLRTVQKATENAGPSPELPTVVLVHAVNPIGMHLYKTMNERNVELNRACRTKEEWRDFKENLTVRENYELFHQLLRLRSEPQWWTEHWFKVLLSWFILRHGVGRLDQIIEMGQAHNSGGLFFAGYEEFEETGIENLKGVLYDLRQSGIKGAVTLVNVQTAPGKLGESTVRTNDRSTVWPMDGEEELERWFPAFEKDVSYQHSGRVIDHFEKAFEMIQVPLLIEHDIGTVSANWALKARVIERAAEEHCEDDMEKWRVAYRTTREAYYPSSSAFRASVLEKGVEVLEGAMDRSVRSSPLKMSAAV